MNLRLNNIYFVPKLRPAAIKCILLALVAAIVAAGSGCTGIHNWVDKGFKVGPDYCTPPAPVSDEWIDYEDSDVISDSVDYSHWWSEFQDPTLDQLISTASQGNLDLQSAGMRILAGRARLGIAQGSLFPQVQQAYGGFARINGSTTAANLFPVSNFDSWNTGFNASWEIDFWGRFRRAIEAQDNLLNASVENYDNVLVILQAEVATAYIQYRTLQNRLNVAEQNAKLQQRTLEIADVQFRNGKVTELDVAQGKENLAATLSAIPAFESSIRQTGNAICVLLGQPPHDLSDELGEGPIPQAPTKVFVGIPADLLRRRPDVRRAERLAAAQSAAIGVAEADFYPQIAITGFIGLESQNLSNLFNSKSIDGTIGPGFRWNVLNYGRIRNNVRLNEARFYQLVLDYQSTVLTANQEVEDGIVSFIKERERANALSESATQAQRAVDISTTQYQRGRINFQPVVYTQQILAERQDQLATSRGAVSANVVAVYKAVGGGWQTRTGGGGVPMDSINAPFEMTPELEGGIDDEPVEDLTLPPVPVAANEV